MHTATNAAVSIHFRLARRCLSHKPEFIALSNLGQNR
jgi:hypothetical protein